MAEKKTTTEETQEFPDTYEKLVEAYPLLAELPELTAAENLTIAEGVRFGITRRLVAGRQQKIATLLKKKSLSLEDEDEVAYLSGEATNAALVFFESIASDTKRFEEWGHGLDPDAVSMALMLLLRFYGEQMGKSTTSRANTKPIE